MSQNQSNKTYESALNFLRQEIDEIDNTIISALQKRMEIVEKVAKLKAENNEKFFIRSNREADMIKELIKKSDGKLPKNLIISIWRKIITTANMREQNLRIAINNPHNLANYSALVREYYNEIVPIHNFDSPNSTISALQKGEAEIAIFSLPQILQEEKKEDAKENWWISLANNKEGLRVFAKIPFFEFDKKDNNSLELVVVAAKNPEKSSDDLSLIYIEVTKEIAKSQILSELKNRQLSVRILKSVRLNQVEGMVFYLIEVDGFFLESDDIIKDFSKSKIRPYIKVLGHYARPIKI